MNPALLYIQGRALAIRTLLQSAFPTCDFNLEPGEGHYLVGTNQAMLRGFLGGKSGPTETEIIVSLQAVVNTHGKVVKERASLQITDILKQTGERQGVTSRATESSPTNSVSEWLFQEIHKEVLNIGNRDMMQISPAELRRLTNAAVKEGERQREIALEQQKEKEAREAEKQRLRAKHIIDQIPGRCRTEAEAGRGHAVVMDIKYADYDQPRNVPGSACRPEWLKGACAIVWKFCQEAKLEPSIESWHDGVGINGGYNIVVHW